MAQISVTELMTDPDFVDQMQLVTRTPIVNARGENQLQESAINSIGSIQPISGRVVQKMPESFKVENVQSFWFKGKIIASAPGKYSSILVFKGFRYQVRLVFDWSHFGEGYTEGLCVAEVPAA